MSKTITIKGYSVTLDGEDVRIEKGAFVLLGMFSYHGGSVGSLELSEYTPDGKPAILSGKLIDRIESELTELAQDLALEAEDADEADPEVEAERTEARKLAAVHRGGLSRVKG